MKTTSLIFAALTATAALIGCDPTTKTTDEVTTEDGVAVSSGYVDACLGNDTIDEDYYGYNTFEISGAVVADGLFEKPDYHTHRCYAPARAVTICDADGVIWTVGYDVLNEDGDSIALPLDVSPGDAVNLHFASLQDHGVIAGFVLRDDEGIIAALEQGSWGPALGAEGGYPIDEFVVTTGESAALEDTNCGEIEHTMLDFAGDTDISLAPGQSAPFTAGGVSLTASAIRSFDYTGEPTCTDVAGASIWTVWR